MGFIVEHKAAQKSGEDHANALASPNLDDSARSSLTFPYPVSSQIADILDEFFAQDPAMFVPVASPLMAFSRSAIAKKVFAADEYGKVMEIEKLVVNLRKWFSARPISPIPSELDATVALNGAVDITSIDAATLSKLNPVDVVKGILRNINNRSIPVGEVYVQFSPASCEVLCRVETMFDKDWIWMSVLRPGSQPLRFSLDYKFLGRPVARIHKAGNLASRNPGTGSDKTRMRRAQRLHAKQMRKNAGRQPDQQAPRSQQDQ